MVLFFVAGTRVDEKRLGFVADFCEKCRSIEIFKLFEIRKVAHIYWLSIGKGEVVEHNAKCTKCMTEYNASLTDYLAVSKNNKSSTEELAQETNPGVFEYHEHWKALEEKIRRGKLSSEERMQLMIQRLLRVARAVEKRAATSSIDLQSGLAFLAALILPFLFILTSTKLEGSTAEILLLAGIALGAGAFLFALVSMATDPSRFIKKKLKTDIVEILQPFHPSPRELEEIVKSYRTSKTAFGKKVKASWLEAILLERPDPFTGGTLPR